MASRAKVSRITKAIVYMVLAVFAGVIITVFPAKNVKAAGDVRFGSVAYAPSANTDFNIGVYVSGTAERPLGKYRLMLSYDPNMISFVSGGVAGEEGVVYVEGTSADGGESMNMLTFHALGNVGDTGINVIGVDAYDTAGESLEIGNRPAAPIGIQVAKTAIPEYLRVNNKEVAGLTAGQTEYTFSVPFDTEFVVEAPEGYTVQFQAPVPQVGRNDITVTLTQPNAEPLVLVLHANMTEKKEEPETSEEPSETPSEDISEIPSEDLFVETESEGQESSEAAIFEPVTSEEEPIQDTNPARESGFPPNNRIHYSFQTSDLLFIGGCLLGAVILFIVILVIMNGESVEYEEEEDEDSDLEDWDYDSIKFDEVPAKRREESNHQKNEPAESGKKKSEEKKSARVDTSTGDDIVAATYRKKGEDASGRKKKEAVGTGILDEHERKKKELKEAAEREKREAEKAEKAERAAAEKEKKEAEKAERAAAEKEKKEAEKAERAAAEKEKKEAEKAERAAAEREKKEAEKAEKDAALREKKEAEKERRNAGKAEREAAHKEKREAERSRKERSERERREAEKAERNRTRREKEEEVSEDTSELSFLPLDYTPEDIEKKSKSGKRNFSGEMEFLDNDDAVAETVVGAAELVFSEEIADFAEDAADDAVLAAGAAAGAVGADAAGKTAGAAMVGAGAVSGATTVAEAIRAGIIRPGNDASSAKPLTDAFETEEEEFIHEPFNTLLMDREELGAKIESAKGAEEYEDYDEIGDDGEEYDDSDDFEEDEDGFIDLDKLSDRK